MRVLYVASKLTGGAGIALTRHLDATRHLHESMVLTMTPEPGISDGAGRDPLTRAISRRQLWRRLAALPVWLYPVHPPVHFSYSLMGRKIARHIDRFKPDLINLHWFGDLACDLRELAKVRVPIAVTLHDTMPFTGGCHYPLDCTRYRDHCGSCPMLGSDSDRDLSWRNLELKRAAFARPGVFAIGLTPWIGGLARRSGIFLPDQVLQSMCVTPDTFQVRAKEPARADFGLPTDVPLVGVGADGDLSYIKGGDLVGRIRQALPERVKLVSFGGREKPDWADHHVGRISGDVRLSSFYSAMDAMLLTSRQENCCQVLLEANCCGTPVVAWRGSGGPGDLLDHCGGVLVEEFTPSAFAAGIERSPAMDHRFPDHPRPDGYARSILELFRRIATERA